MPQERDWRSRSRDRVMVISASQLESFQLCPRKWWLRSVRKLYDPPKGSTTFGTVLHEVLERYLGADDTGRDPRTGQPVDIFPPGWHIAKNKYTGEVDGEINQAEATILWRLIQLAIEDGVLVRRPGRVVEGQFRRSIVQLGCSHCHARGCQHCQGTGVGTDIQITGFIDVAWPEGIEDHKSTKSMRYARSARPGTKKFLGDNTQMLVYARMEIQRMIEEGIPVPPVFELRHNVYCKDPEKPEVRKVEVKVETAKIIQFWDSQVQPTAQWMSHWREHAERWSHVPDHAHQNACNAYGGCPYLTICTGREDEKGYEERVDRYRNERYAAPTFQAAPLTIEGSPPPFRRN